jgi:energy-coupling factor transport system substrate-specific component
VKVNIDKSEESVSDVKVAVPFVDADGEFIYADDNGKITIPSNVSRVTIYSYVYTYSLMNPNVTYHLEGFDKDTITVDRTDLEPVVYTNLDGGKYEFVIRLQTSLGEGDNEVSIEIEKTKAIYEKLWFRLLMAIIGLGIIAAIVFFYVHRKTKALLKKEQENKIFIREMIEAFAKTIDMKDKYTNGHSTRVAEYTAMLTKELGYDEETVEKYYNIGLLHDIGKIGIPPEVLNKPGKLTDQEFNIIKSHSAQGYKVLKDISIMPELAIGAGAHHERPDGKGYPRGLKGDEIPRVAQIIAVADTFDAMYSDRPYRKRMNFEKAVSIIKEVSGTQLESDVVDAFLRLVDKGEFRAPDDDGGGSTEDINNIHKKQDAAVKKEEAIAAKAAEKKSAEESEKKTNETAEKADDK